MKRIQALMAPILLLLVLLAVWEGAVRGFELPHYILPAPSRIAIAFVSHFSSLLHHAATTLAEIALGLILGGIGGFGLAILIFYSPLLERALYPLVLASQMIPVFAIAPLLIVWMGYGLWPKATVAALIGFFPVVVNASDGLRAPSEETVELFHEEADTFFVTPESNDSFIFSRDENGDVNGLTMFTLGGAYDNAVRFEE